MENNLNGGKKQVTKENMSYETTDTNLKTIEIILLKNKLFQQHHHKRRLGMKEVEQDPVYLGQRHKYVEVLTYHDHSSQLCISWLLDRSNTSL